MDEAGWRASAVTVSAAAMAGSSDDESEGDSIGPAVAILWTGWSQRRDVMAVSEAAVERAARAARSGAWPRRARGGAVDKGRTGPAGRRGQARGRARWRSGDMGVGVAATWSI